MTPAPWIVLSVALCAGCGKGPGVVDKPGVDKPSGGSQIGSNMKDASKSSFVKGPALVPKAALIEWLDGQKRNGEPRLVRLPLVLSKVNGMYDISKARIGTAADALEVYANDSALGVGLADRASNKCEGPTCGFLIEGYWRGQQAGSFELQVNKAELLPDDRLASSQFAEVEGETGN